MATDDFSAHEALDRCQLIASMADQHLLSHPYFAENDQSRRWVEQAIDALNMAYQVIGTGSEKSQERGERRTREKVVEGLRALTGANPEDAHEVADRMLLEMLRAAGMGDVADAFDEARCRIGFWYA